ncbi:MAG: prepilin-type N-terminal cleavage/methylation domain-containing protein [Lentisphaerae bacterium]|nr:MAG: prepilin-type N-terminal cleavage/methylation domain-containing protein [Lentisphaerota bacterium]
MPNQSTTIRPDSARIQGFTLIELLVVVTIIAILAAILLPSLSRARAIAKTTVCKNNIKQLGLVMRLYTEEFNAVPPTKFGCCPWPKPQWIWVFRDYSEENGARMRPYKWQSGGWKEGDVYCPVGFEYKDGGNNNRMDYNINMRITNYSAKTYRAPLIDAQPNNELIVVFHDGWDAWNKVSDPYGAVWGNKFYDGVHFTRMLGLIHHYKWGGTVFSFWDGHVEYVRFQGTREAYYDENSDIMRWKVKK